jgi:hypothetical protein
LDKAFKYTAFFRLRKRPQKKFFSFYFFLGERLLRKRGDIILLIISLKIYHPAPHLFREVVKGSLELEEEAAMSSM